MVESKEPTAVGAQLAQKANGGGTWRQPLDCGGRTPLLARAGGRGRSVECGAALDGLGHFTLPLRAKGKRRRAAALQSLAARTRGFGMANGGRWKEVGRKREGAHGVWKGRVGGREDGVGAWKGAAPGREDGVRGRGRGGGGRREEGGSQGDGDGGFFSLNGCYVGANANSVGLNYPSVDVNGYSVVANGSSVAINAISDGSNG